MKSGFIAMNKRISMKCLYPKTLRNLRQNSPKKDKIIDTMNFGSRGVSYFNISSVLNLTCQNWKQPSNIGKLENWATFKNQTSNNNVWANNFASFTQQSRFGKLSFWLHALRGQWFSNDDVIKEVTHTWIAKKKIISF